MFFAYLLKSPWSIFDGTLYDLTDLLLKIEGKNRIYSPLQQACLFMLSQLSSDTIKVSVHFQSFIDSSAPLDSFTSLLRIVFLLHSVTILSSFKNMNKSSGKTKAKNVNCLVRSDAILTFFKSVFWDLPCISLILYRSSCCRLLFGWVDTNIQNQGQPRSFNNPHLVSHQNIHSDFADRSIGNKIEIIVGWQFVGL